MSREKIKCPNCECKVLISEVENNDGLCPECGQNLFGFQSKLFDDYEDEEDDMELEDQEDAEYDDEDEYEDDFDEEDIYEDDFDEEDEDDR